MKILMIGYIFGRPGRRAVRELLDPLIARHDIDFVVANGENAAGGFGLTRSIVDELFRYGVQVITGGNHTFDKKEILTILEEEERVLRPHNYPSVNPGAGTVLMRHEGVNMELTARSKIGHPRVRYGTTPVGTEVTIQTKVSA